MRTDRSFQTKKPSLKTQIFYVFFLFNSTVELNFAIFYVGGHDYIYIPLLYIALSEGMCYLPPFNGNQKQPLIHSGLSKVWDENM